MAHIQCYAPRASHYLQGLARIASRFSTIPTNPRLCGSAVGRERRPPSGLTARSQRTPPRAGPRSAYLNK
ncbi:hypothetical protein EVAR_8197_1 [Eumeta japonica]|uniref:Uncharacterized protein n=1 Tax=Eumeta variegata TaxID=151549 RepID=A0A4C1TI55_EUMVA|nr:hypothetical protein EVAR_8197_1 [Eumeta japonica]